jgi:hypothetical protein
MPIGEIAMTLADAPLVGIGFLKSGDDELPGPLHCHGFLMSPRS